jgi:adenylate cyclase
VRPLIAGVAIGLLSVLLVLGLDQAFTRLFGDQNPLQTAEMKAYDWRMKRVARPETARKDIALVYIDEASLRTVEPIAGRWPWPRVMHAMLIDYLARGPAKVVGYDVNFAQADDRTGFTFAGETWSGAKSDQALADSIRKAGNVIMLADATYDGELPNVEPIPDSGYKLDVPGIVDRRSVLTPFPLIAHAASALGHNLFILDPDGPIRHVVPFVRSHQRALPSLGVAAALRVAQVPASSVSLVGTTLNFGHAMMPLAWRSVRSSEGMLFYLWGLTNFRGPALGEDLKSTTYKTYTVDSLLISEDQLQQRLKPNVDPAVFKDKIVFVGTTASGLFDVFETPFSNGKMPGVNIHAAVADDILSNRFMHPVPASARIASVFLAGVSIGVIATMLPVWWATALSVGIIAAFGTIGARLFAVGYWLNVTQPFVAASVALFSGVGYQYFVEGREKRKMKKLFGQYVSKDVYDHLVADPSLARLGGTRREMSVLFSDIRGFTTVSERGQPEEIVHTLNEYFTKMVEIVFKHQGTVDKFVGDMVMALFGAPLDDPEHAEHAVEAALDMLAELKRLNQTWKSQGRPELDIGIGVNSGPMIAGNIGSEQIMSYTVIGDAVNLGSRLESLNKQYSTRIIISEATRSKLTGRYELRPLGDVVVKGKTRPVAIFEVVGRLTVDGLVEQVSPVTKEASV